MKAGSLRNRRMLKQNWSPGSLTICRQILEDLMQQSCLSEGKLPSTTVPVIATDMNQSMSSTKCTLMVPEVWFNCHRNGFLTTNAGTNHQGPGRLANVELNLLRLTSPSPGCNVPAIPSSSLFPLPSSDSAAANTRLLQIRSGGTAHDLHFMCQHWKRQCQANHLSISRSYLPPASK